MRLVLDLQGAQGENRRRGIGQYSTALAEAMIRNAGSHHLTLVLNGRLAEADPTLRERFQALLPADQIKVWTPPGQIQATNPQNRWLRRSAELLRENFLAALKPDLLHLSSVFEGLSSEAVTSLGRGEAAMPCAVTLYDLIPLLHPELYLKPNPLVEGWYQEKLDHLRRADLLLAISESSRQEAITYLNFPEDRVIAIGAAVGPQFRPLALAPEQCQVLRQQWGLTRPFILYTGGIDPRKNVEGLIRAFAALPAPLRDQHQLVVVCAVSAADRDRLQALARQQGLPASAVILTGFVPEADLVALYSLCALFVFPSWHEGFGLPALEAMACGAPVIAADSSSLPEVIGRRDALFAPRDDQAMTAKMVQLLTDPAWCQELRTSGLEQAKKFSWDHSAKRALEGFAQLLPKARRPQSPASPAKAKPRLAFISPLPPARSGIADYSAELLPVLASHYQIDVILDQPELEDPWVKANCPLRSLAWFEDHAGEFDRLLYHFGNSEFHSHMFELLQRHPGMVVLHDFFLSGIVAHREFHSGDSHGWSRALYQSHGYGALQERASRGNDAAIIDKYPCNLNVLQHSVGIVVHSDFPRQLAAHWYGEEFAQRFSVVPLLRAPLPDTDRARARQSLGLDPDDFVVCSFGRLGPIKLNDRLLSAWLASSLGKERRCRLIFVGENDDGPFGHAFAKTLAQTGAGPRIAITGFASQEVYRHYLAAADLAVQLRSRSRGETSAAVLDCMNCGLPTIVNAHGSFKDLPDQAVCKLPDPFTDGELAQALERLWQNPAERQALSLRGQAEIRSHHAPAPVAEQYAVLIEQAYGEPRPLEQTLAAVVGPQAPALDDPAWGELAFALDRSFPPLTPQKQLLVDISELVTQDAKSGIQRVVRNILGQWLAKPPAGYRVEPVYATTSQPYRYARQFTANWLGCPAGLLSDEIVDFAPGDCFIGLDLQPHVVPSQQAYFNHLRQQGVRVQFVVYDLLCLQRPDCFQPGAAQMFSKWLDAVVANDGALCISAAVAADLRAWLAVHHPERKDHFTITHFHLGADFVSHPDAAGLPPAWQNRPCPLTLLMVGTIEPRKGYGQALSAAEALWAEGVDFTLAIAGRVGWMVEDLVARLRHHPELGRRLFWFEGLEDNALAALFTEADGLLLASEGEGFGLPLVEAAHYGLPILTRDLAVFREVAGDHACYFAEDLTASLKQWLTRLAAGNVPNPAGIGQMSWAESARQLADRLLPEGDDFRRHSLV